MVPTYVGLTCGRLSQVRAGAGTDFRDDGAQDGWDCVAMLLAITVLE